MSLVAEIRPSDPAAVVSAKVSKVRPSPLVGLAVVAISSAVGVLLVSEADIRSRAAQPGAYFLFWLGLGMIFLPAAWRICRIDSDRGERLVLVGVLGISLYIVKCLYSPESFVFHDEYAHVRTMLNMVTSGRLFGFNPEIRVASDFPGLGLVTVGLSRVSSLSLTSSGMVVIGASRLLLMVSLFLLLERLTGSHRIAGISCLIYTGNANFLYWDAQFAYESLALPLAIAVLYLLTRRSEGGRGYVVLAVVISLMVVITHHLTSYALLALLSAWTIGAWIRSRHGESGALSYVPVVPATFLALSAGLWMVLVAPLTLGYLLPVFGRALGQGVTLILHQKSGRVLFANPGGAVQPRWEQLVAFVAVLLILTLVPLGLLARRKRWAHPLASLLAWMSLLYFLMLPLRFTLAGQEAANRSGEFLFVGIALVLATLVVTGIDIVAQPRVPGVKVMAPLIEACRRIPIGSNIVTFAVCTIMFVGGVAVSWSFAERLPPPFRTVGVAATPTPDVVAAARWMRAQYGSNQRVATDITTGLAFDTFGQQNVLSGASDGSHIWRIFEPLRMNAAVYGELLASNVNFVVVDNQLTEGLPPISGVPVFDNGEPLQRDKKPVPTRSLQKFVNAPGLTEVYVSRTISIYQIDRAQLQELLVTR